MINITAIKSVVLKKKEAAIRKYTKTPLSRKSAVCIMIGFLQSIAETINDRINKLKKRISSNLFGSR